MVDHHAQNKVPRGFIIGAGILILFALAATLFSRTADVGRVAMPPAEVVESQSIRFVARGGGSYDVHEQTTGRVIASLEAGEGGFVLGALRGLNRNRMRQGVDYEAPYEIIRWSDGRLTLVDRAADQTIEADAFGPTNAESLARLLDAARTTD